LGQISLIVKLNQKLFYLLNWLLIPKHTSLKPIPCCFKLHDLLFKIFIAILKPQISTHQFLFTFQIWFCVNDDLQIKAHYTYEPFNLITLLFPLVFKFVIFMTPTHFLQVFFNFFLVEPFVHTILVIKKFIKDLMLQNYVYCFVLNRCCLLLILIGLLFSLIFVVISHWLLLTPLIEFVSVNTLQYTLKYHLKTPFNSKVSHFFLTLLNHYLCFINLISIIYFTF
jgi:hypothetical protein